VEGAEAMDDLGRRLAGGLRNGQVVFLRGDLGAGKTTLFRGMMRGLGHLGAVKSPTFTLLETYRLGDLDIYHFDLYRLSDPEELEDLAWRDYVGTAVCVFEWPEKGSPLLPQPDCAIDIGHDGPDRRQVTFRCLTPLGESLCASA
jgi:tRNA threonylcarbamoyladenosine biosynthesis protein TsaE